MVEQDDDDNQDDDQAIQGMAAQIDDMKHSEFVGNILYYIAGFIVLKLQKKLTCQDCNSCLLAALVDTDDHRYTHATRQNSAFTSYVNRGGLNTPSDSVVRVVNCAEHEFKLFVCKKEFDNISNMKKLKEKMIMEVIHHFNPENRSTYQIFSTHPHDTNELAFEEDHKHRLVKFVAEKYFMLRLFTYGKQYCKAVIQAGKGSQRHQLTKLVLFKNQ